MDDILLSSQEGIIIRLHANEIPLQSRYGSGVRVMRLGENDKVMVLARTDHDDEAQTEQIDASEAEAELTAEQLAENYGAVYDEILRMKPAAAKGQYIKSCVTASTMGPGIKIVTKI